MPYNLDDNGHLQYVPSEEGSLSFETECFDEEEVKSRDDDIEKNNNDALNQYVSLAEKVNQKLLELPRVIKAINPKASDANIIKVINYIESLMQNPHYAINKEEFHEGYAEPIFEAINELVNVNSTQDSDAKTIEVVQPIFIDLCKMGLLDILDIARLYINVEDIPENFSCLLGKNIMSNPVADPKQPDNLFDRKNIVRHLKTSPRNPFTQEGTLFSKDLVYNYKFKLAIDSFLKDYVKNNLQDIYNVPDEPSFEDEELRQSKRRRVEPSK